jgi:RNA polymerase sigma factor (sigma-70 family)
VSEVTRILSQIEAGDPQAADKLLPLVYDELRKLAAVKLAQEEPGQTLQATALVHEAYLRLVGSEVARNQEPVATEGSGVSGHRPLATGHWNSRGHFFGAAAEAMRRILVERARRQSRLKHGGDRQRHDIESVEIAAPESSDELLALDECLARLEKDDPAAAQLVKLRYFAGLTIPQAAQALGISARKADFLWSFARAWLRREIQA